MPSVQWEAVVRALRTFVQGLLAAGVVSVYDAVQGALAGGVGFDIKKIITIAVGAFLAGVISYVMNVISPPASVRKSSE